MINIEKKVQLCVIEQQNIFKLILGMNTGGQIYPSLQKTVWLNYASNSEPEIQEDQHSSVLQEEALA